MELGIITYFVTIFTLIMGLNPTGEEAVLVNKTENVNNVSAVVSEEEKNNLAKCLTEKGVIMYGAYWCPHCQNQKHTFGEAFQFVTYQECDDKGPNGNAQACVEADVKSYPTWQLPGEHDLQGEQSLKKLSDWSDCPYQPE